MICLYYIHIALLPVTDLDNFTHTSAAIFVQLNFDYYKDKNFFEVELIRYSNTIN